MRELGASATVSTLRRAIAPQGERANRMCTPRQLGSVDMCDHAAAGCACKSHEQEIAKNPGRGIRDADMDQVRRRAQPQRKSGEKANLP